MNQLLDNLLLIDEKIQDIHKFMKIKFHIESLDVESRDYKTLVDQTNLLIKVLTAFSKE